MPVISFTGCIHGFPLLSVNDISVPGTGGENERIWPNINPFLWGQHSSFTILLNCNTKISLFSLPGKWLIYFNWIVKLFILWKQSITTCPHITVNSSVQSLKMIYSISKQNTWSIKMFPFIPLMLTLHKTAQKAVLQSQNKSVASKSLTKKGYFFIFFMSLLICWCQADFFSSNVKLAIQSLQNIYCSCRVPTVARPGLHISTGHPEGTKVTEQMSNRASVPLLACSWCSSSWSSSAQTSNWITTLAAFRSKQQLRATHKRMMLSEFEPGAETDSSTKAGKA